MTPENLIPSPYLFLLMGSGVLVALVAWLPLALKRAPLSLPIVCVAIGAALFALPQITFKPLPLRFPYATEHFSELIVIISLMGAGLKLDRIFGWRRWAITWRLIGITMPLGIAAIALVAGWLLDVPCHVALLIAACLAPTDPVLAADVQVGPPRIGEEDEVRFGLTSEAGLNDGAAFPFVHLAILLAASAASGRPWLAEWLGHRVLWEILGGVGGGWLIGRAFGWLTFHVPVRSKLAKTGDGLIALAATLVSYGFVEAIHAYGFMAVFVTALTFRHAHRDHDLHAEMHAFTEQIERLAMMAMLILFGGAVLSGLLDRISWTDVAVATVIILFVRPLTGWIGLIGFRAALREKFILAFFGIRGVGSIFYAAYGLNHMAVADPARIWGIVGMVVLISILLHGLTVTSFMRSLDNERARQLA